MILYIKSSKVSTHTHTHTHRHTQTHTQQPVRINEFCKVAEYKINTQKSVAFLYTSNEKSEKETYPVIV